MGKTQYDDKNGEEGRREGLMESGEVHVALAVCAYMLEVWGWRIGGELGVRGCRCLASGLPECLDKHTSALVNQANIDKPEQATVNPGKPVASPLLRPRVVYMRRSSGLQQRGARVWVKVG